MTGKLKMLGYATCLIAGPAMAAFAVGTDSTTTTTTAPSYAATGSATPSSSGQAQMSAAQRDQWAASHPRAADTGSSPTRSGIAGGGGEGSGGSGGGSGAGSR